MKQINEAAESDEQVLRISMDAKATIQVGLFSRGGKSRVRTLAMDHDFDPVGKVTPVGIFIPRLDELFLYVVTSRVTADCLVDRLVQWWESVKDRFADVKTDAASIWTMAQRITVGGPSSCNASLTL